MDRKPIAICIAQAGYGTCYFDPITFDCEHECYASINEIILNEKYWSQYDKIMSNALNSDFDLGFNFDNYKLIVYDDGSNEAILLGD